MNTNPIVISTVRKRSFKGQNVKREEVLVDSAREYLRNKGERGALGGKVGCWVGGSPLRNVEGLKC